jgi:hypothetical protein
MRISCIPGPENAGKESHMSRASQGKVRLQYVLGLRGEGPEEGTTALQSKRKVSWEGGILS